ncbi:MAG: hypothetical protein ACOCRK_05025 [bacterium]
MQKKRPAFKFIGRAKEKVSPLYTSDIYINNFTAINQTVGNAGALIDVFGNFVRFCAEKEKTRQIYKQIGYSKQMLDQMVKERKKQVEIELKEYQNKLEFDLRIEKQKLEENLSLIRVRYNKLISEQRLRNKEYLEILDIENKIRHPVELRLSKTSNLIKISIKVGRDQELIAHLNEQFRKTQRTYNKMLESLELI